MSRSNNFATRKLNYEDIHQRFFYKNNNDDELTVASLYTNYKNKK